MTSPPTIHQSLRLPGSFTTDSGATLLEMVLAYQAYGTLNTARDNVILVFHALSGDQYACGTHPVTGRAGWWNRMVGPGKPLDTERFYVLCFNVPGGCMGSTGPSTTRSETGRAWGPDFPILTIQDMVRAQAQALDYWDIDTVHTVVGGSMGGMQALTFAQLYPGRADHVIALGTPFRHSAQNIGFSELGRQAIMADPAWAGGRYDPPGPVHGLAVARMAAHLTYLSRAGMARKFDRNLQDKAAVSFSLDADYQVESYLRHQGVRFTERFDANSYLIISRAMDYFDLGPDRDLGTIFTPCQSRFLFVTFSSDWLYPTDDVLPGIAALAQAGMTVRHKELETDLGHDAFLLDVPELDHLLREELSI